MPQTVEGTVPVATPTAIFNQSKLLFDDSGRFKTSVNYSNYGKYTLNLETIGRSGERRDAAHTVFYVPVFRDLIDHPALKTLQQLAAIGVFTPDASGMFGPEQAVTRADAVFWLAKALDIAPNPQRRSPFLDIESNHPLYPYLPVLIDENWFSSQQQIKLNPTALLTRAQAIELLVRASWNAGEAPAALPYTDVSATTPLAGFVAKALKMGIVNPAEKLNPNQELNKLEYLLMISKLSDVQTRLQVKSY